MMSRAAQTHLAGRVFETPGLERFEKMSKFTITELPYTEYEDDEVRAGRMVRL